MALTGYMLTVGFVSKATLEADTTKDIGNWAVQSDMEPGRRWMRPDNESEVADEGAELVSDPLGGLGAYGGAQFVWGMQYLTPLMVKYIKDTYFSNGTLFSQDVTVRTYNRESGAFEVYQCTVQRDFGSKAVKALGGLNTYKLTFINGTKMA